MPVTVTSIDRTLVPSDGGYLIKIEGVFETGTDHSVHLGITGTSADPKAFAGQGKGTVVQPFTGIEMRVWTPRLPVGGLLDVLVIQTSTSDQDSLVDVLTVVQVDYKTSVFDNRRVQPPHYKMGPRNMDGLDPV